MTENYPFKVPELLPPSSKEVFSYWENVRRGQAKIPFSDDIKLSALPGREGDLILLDAFAKPNRYRFGIVGENIVAAYGRDIAGLFLDEIEPGLPLNLIQSQASAAAELRMPSFYAGDDYLRLLLPAWGDGHVSALLGFVGPKMPSM